MDACRRMEELMRTPGLLELVEASQPAEGPLHERLELDSAYSRIATFEQFHSRDRPLISHMSLPPNSRPTLDNTWTSQSNDSSLHHRTEVASSPDGIMYQEQTENHFGLRQHMVPRSTSPVFNDKEQPQFAGRLLKTSDIITSSPSNDTYSIILTSDDSNQPMEILPLSQASSIAIDFQCSYSNLHQPQAQNPTLTSTLLQEAEDFEHIDHSLRHPASQTPIRPDIDRPNLRSNQVYQQLINVSGATTLNNTVNINSRNQSLNPFPKSIPSSLCINTPGFIELADSSSNCLPESLINASKLETVHRAPFGQENLRPHGMRPPNLSLSGTVDIPTIVEKNLHQFPDVMPTFTVPEDGATSDFSDEEPDITPLQYARQNGLSHNHLQALWDTSNLNTLPGYQTSLVDDSHLPKFDLKADVNTDERLIISKDAAMLISSVSREESSEWYDDTINRIIRISRYRTRRLELPLLRSDNETDLKEFALRQGFEPKLEDIKLPLEIIDEDENGGFSFSRALLNKGAEILEGLKKERLEVSRDTLLYLHECLRDDWGEADEEKVWASAKTDRNSRALEPVTPPLSPLSFPTQPYEPSISDPIFELPILSDPESLTQRDLEDLEKQLFENDVPTPIKQGRDSHGNSSDTFLGSETVSLADIYPPAAWLERLSVSPGIERKRLKREDLKVEEPLSPSFEVTFPKIVSFDETTLQLPAAKASSSSDPMESSYFDEAFGDALVKATRMSEQEPLIAADKTGRVKVPEMDFSMPVPPWHATLNRPKRTSLIDIQRAMIMDSIGNTLPKWPGLGKVKVRYNPFPHDLAKVALEERCFEDDSTWEKIIKDPEDEKVIDTSILTWKPARMMIMRDEDDDEEIEPSQFEKGVPQDLSFLVKKRKIEIEERDTGGYSGRKDLPHERFAKQPPRKKTPKSTEFEPQVRKPQLNLLRSEGNLLMAGNFSVGKSVDNFLEIRGTKKPRLCDSSYSTKTVGLLEPHLAAKSSAQPELLMQLPIRKSPVPKIHSPLPAPTSNISSGPVSIIVASPFLKHRTLIKNIETLFPGIVLVERDFSAHDTTVWMPGSVTRSPIASPLALEADINVSPLVGIIITTLQKIKQKPLPGQKTKSAIRERLEKVSPKYERVIVLVTEKREDETTRCLDENDCNAFTEFVGFSLGLGSSIDIQFIGGGEATLAKWLVNIIVQNRIDEEILAEETHWELFLRRAGLNPFAAQHIIAALKALDSTNVPNSSKAAHFGLAAFVEMGREQRIARFGPVCGHQLMARVSAVIDASWQ